MNPIQFNFSGMKRPDQIPGNLTALSIDGSGCAVSYLVKRNGRKLYGRYNYQSGKYDEQPA